MLVYSYHKLDFYDCFFLDINLKKKFNLNKLPFKYVLYQLEILFCVIFLKLLLLVLARILTNFQKIVFL